MQYKSFILFCLYLLSATNMQLFCDPPKTAINFDDLESQMIENEYQDEPMQPPHPIMVFLRKIGFPFLSLYVQVQQKCKNYWHSYIEYLKQNCKCADEK